MCTLGVVKVICVSVFPFMFNSPCYYKKLNLHILKHSCGNYKNILLVWRNQITTNLEKFSPTAIDDLYKHSQSIFRAVTHILKELLKISVFECYRM